MASPGPEDAMLALLASVGETVQQTGAVVAVPGGDEAAAASLRCLDPSHGDVCTRCCPAPVPGDEAAYELVGDPGRKNGEKLLKSLLSRTPEWRSREARAQAAVACDAEGHEALGRVMRGHDTSAALRKRDMLFLARLWGYKSTLWRVRMPRLRGGTAGGATSRKAGSTHLGEEGDGGEVAPAPVHHAPRRQQLQQQHSVPPPAAMTGQGGHNAQQPGGGMVMPYMEATPIVVNLPGICGPLPALLLVQPPPLVKALLAAGPLTAVLTSTDLASNGGGGGMQRHAHQHNDATAQAAASMEAAHQQLLPFMTAMQQCRPEEGNAPGMTAGLGLHAGCGAGPAGAPQGHLPFAATMLDIRAVLASLSRAAPAG